MTESEIAPDDFVALALSAELEDHRYGYSLRIESGDPRPPGIIALTWILGRNEDDRNRIRGHSKKNVEQFLTEPGFISIVTGFIGLRGFTVTAWVDEPSMKRALSGNHAGAMRELFEEDFVSAVWTSVWVPSRINTLWVRCSHCAALQDGAREQRACDACGAELPDQLAYW